MLKYLNSLGLKPSWDEVEFLIRRFLYESEYFRNVNPLRWDWKDYNMDSDDTHYESHVNLNRKVKELSIRVFIGKEN